MITFDSSYTKISVDETGSISEVPINSYLRSVHINLAGVERNGIIITDTSGNYGMIFYQNSGFASTAALFAYLYPFTQIGKPRTDKIEICDTELIDSFTNPIELVADPGNGLIVNPIGFSYKFKYGSVPYDFAQNLYVHASTKTDADCFFEINKGIINAAADRSGSVNHFTPAGVSTQNALTEGDSVIFKAKTSDATQGDGHLTIYFTYSIVEESWYDGVYCT